MLNIILIIIRKIVNICFYPNSHYQRQLLSVYPVPFSTDFYASKLHAYIIS